MHYPSTQLFFLHGAQNWPDCLTFLHHPSKQKVPQAFKNEVSSLLNFIKTHIWFSHRSPWMCYNCVSHICSLSLSHTLRRWSCFNYYCGAVQRFMSLIRTAVCVPVCEDEVNTWGVWYTFGKNCWAKHVFTDFLQTVLNFILNSESQS